MFMVAILLEVAEVAMYSHDPPIVLVQEGLVREAAFMATFKGDVTMYRSAREYVAGRGGQRPFLLQDFRKVSDRTKCNHTKF